jgi:hypothetical protein
MDVSASLDAPVTPERLFEFVDELTDYPQWMPLAHRVTVVGNDADGRPLWDVELRARIGPLARSKRLRMVRSVHDPVGRRVQFERCENDGRTHSPWTLDGRVVTTETGSRLEMSLHYGGALWTGGVLERVLAEQIVAGREQLLALLAE